MAFFSKVLDFFLLFTNAGQKSYTFGTCYVTKQLYSIFMEKIKEENVGEDGH